MRQSDFNRKGQVRGWNYVSLVGPPTYPHQHGAHRSTSERGTHLLSMSSAGTKQVHLAPCQSHPRERAFRPLPAYSRPPSSPSTARINAGGRGMSSSFTSASHCQWPGYGPVPLGRCPDCPQTAPMKRRVTTRDKNGNAGHEYVKCERKSEPGKVRSDFPLFQFRFIFLNFGFSWHWSRGISSNQSRGIRVNIWFLFSGSAAMRPFRVA